uniref:Ig-like domain-containing protein n=1 Tax=Ornithorhynchus anatinus TaxID=9258 RepID=F6YW74_ORNAN
MEKPLGASLLILWLQLGWASGQVMVEQTPPSISIREGETVTMYCSFKTSYFYGLQWYRQYAGKGLESLFFLNSNGLKKVGRLTAELKTSESISSLHIEDSQAGDSATYFCACGDTVIPRHLQLAQKPCLQLALQFTHCFALNELFCTNRQDSISHS